MMAGFSSWFSERTQTQNVLYSQERRLQYARGKRYYAKIQNVTELYTSKRVMHNLVHIAPGLIVLQL